MKIAPVLPVMLKPVVTALALATTVGVPKPEVIAKVGALMTSFSWMMTLPKAEVVTKVVKPTLAFAI
jgi:hypothetical protein